MPHGTAAALTIGLLAIASVGLAQGRLSVKDQMKTVVDPASSVVFAVGGEADPANDPKPHLTDARWAEAVAAAEKLKAAAADLAAPAEAPASAKDQSAKDLWLADAKLMGDDADAALKAARAKDGAALSAAANNLGDSCTTCHGKFKPQAAG